MSRRIRLTRDKHLVHWLVLLALLLGQFALGIGYGIAAERSNDTILIPVCTSTGIEYIRWTPEGIARDSQTNSETTEPTKAKSAAGSCTLCTVSPFQLRFDLQNTLLPEPLATQLTRLGQLAQVVGPTLAFNPRAAPRAPPSVPSNL